MGTESHKWSTEDVIRLLERIRDNEVSIELKLDELGADHIIRRLAEVAEDINLQHFSSHSWRVEESHAGIPVYSVRHPEANMEWSESIFTLVEEFNRRNSDRHHNQPQFYKRYRLCLNNTCTIERNNNDIKAFRLYFKLYEH